MAGKAFRLRWQPTSSSGTITQSMSSWTQIVNGSVRLEHLFLKSSRADTQFDFKITSPNGNVIFSRLGNVGELIEPPNLLMRGIYTFTLENVKNSEGVTLDDTFEGEFFFKDIKDK